MDTYILHRTIIDVYCKKFPNAEYLTQMCSLKLIILILIVKIILKNMNYYVESTKY